MQKGKVCLSMIVKNESQSIERCLRSVMPIIDRWVICDTGSTDGTQDIIRNVLKNIVGELHERHWVSFEHNRNEALQLSKQHAKHSLFIDADDILIIPDGFKMPDLIADGYFFNIDFDNLKYSRIQLINNQLPWQWKGVLHEYLDCPEYQVGSLPLTIKCTNDGFRRQNPDKYKHDCDVLRTALADEQDPFLRSRYTFYLAQSFRDSQQYEQALQAYIDRTKQGYWSEEIYVSYCEAGKMAAILDYPEKTVIDFYLKAHYINSNRLEAIYYLCRYLRLKNRFLEAAVYAKPLLNTPIPDGLFIESWIYQYGLMDEYSVSLYWIGDYATSLQICQKCLDSELPNDYRKRIEQNADFCREKLTIS
jgi:glycosyltransferase involved in cell wall biosynthesis